MRKIAIAAVILGGCAAPDNAPTYVDLCTETVRDYAVLRDDIGLADAYGELFSEDGEFHLAGNVAKGREALIARHKIANADVQWRHNMTDIRISETGDKITGNSRFHIFAGPRSETPVAPNREILGDYTDEFVVENGACKIKVRQVSVIFDKKS